MTLSEIYTHLIASALEVTLIGNENESVTHLATIQNAQPGAIVFLNNRKYRQFLETTKASVVILNANDAHDFQGNGLVTANPYLAWAYVSQLFNPQPVAPSENIHTTAVIHPSARIDNDVVIGPNVVIEAEVTIAAGTYIGPNCLIETGVTIGKNCYFYSNATICYHCIIGENVVLHPGVVIGAQGFGFAKGPKGYIKVAQVGRVILADDVDVGANSCIDRGAIDDTVIGKGSKIDNHVQIGHNCIVGEHTVISGCTGIAGSATIGSHVVIGGGVGMNGHITIADQVMITGNTMVTHSLTEPGLYSSGLPVMDNRKWLRNTAQLQRIDRLYDRVKELEKKLSSDNN